MVLFKVHQALLETDNLELIAKIMRVSSVNDVRVHTVGMPDEGWLVDVQELSCGCLYNAKNGMCLHVLAAGFEAGVCIPGTAAHPRRFVANIHQPRRRTTSVRRAWRTNKAATAQNSTPSSNAYRSDNSEGGVTESEGDISMQTTQCSEEPSPSALPHTPNGLYLDESVYSVLKTVSCKDKMDHQLQYEMNDPCTLTELQPQGLLSRRIPFRRTARTIDASPAGPLEEMHEDVQASQPTRHSTRRRRLIQRGIEYQEQTRKRKR
ncbi:hypothetical protein L914_17802 [Phytophthora nicotianae]|uniref:SWIM-type domain-containing protein n=1 Tax=Phytophthora nicotianae TaxID=4792 RepID=W2MHX6_PHYNI|nr:hypothetical protein L914_17802 [Phytophthora nicotianae]